jgi:hypothetical protein
MICGMFLVGCSFLCDLTVRFSSNSIESIPKVSLGLQLAAVFFFGGTYQLLLSFFTPRNHVPWTRLILYAFLFGMMIDLHFSSDFFVFYDSDLQMWFSNFHDKQRYFTLDILTSLVMVDLMIYILKRHIKGMANQRAKIALNLFWLGVAIPFISSLIFLNDTANMVALRSLGFIMGIVIYSFAFLLEPLGFVLSDVKILDIILAHKGSGDIAIGHYATEIKPFNDIKSQALYGINGLLNEMVSSNKEDKYLINQIHLGSRIIIIERTENFTGYLIGENVDQVCRWALRFLTQHFESHYSNHSKSLMLPEEQVKKDIKKFFTFLSSENAIK